MITREYGDLAGAGGVRDVVRQLSLALAGWRSRKVSVILPLYGFIDVEEAGFEAVYDPLDRNRQLTFAVDMHYPDTPRHETVQVWRKQEQRVIIFALDSPRFREKSGVYTYTEADEENDGSQLRGSGHFDYFAMNVLLQKGALDLIMLLEERPDVVHCHDGHAALTPCLMHELAGYRNYFRSTGALVTIHNGGIGYHQEVNDLSFAAAITGLDMVTLLEEYPITENTPELQMAVPDEDKFDIVNKLAEQGKFGNGKVTTIDGIRVDFNDGWGLLRASNTTPALTARFEAHDTDALERIKLLFREQLASVAPGLDIGF